MSVPIFEELFIGNSERNVLRGFYKILKSKNVEVFYTSTKILRIDHEIIIFKLG